MLSLVPVLKSRGAFDDNSCILFISRQKKKMRFGYLSKEMGDRASVYASHLQFKSLCVAEWYNTESFAIYLDQTLHIVHSEPFTAFVEVWSTRLGCVRLVTLWIFFNF